jgi:hypothetical protein
MIPDLIKLGQELSETQNRAFDLWTWLPSYKVAHKFHGDYASSFVPRIQDIIMEANLYIQYLKDLQMNEERRRWFEECPCGTPHENNI